MSEQTILRESGKQFIDRFLNVLKQGGPPVACANGRGRTIEDLIHSYVAISAQGEAGGDEVATEVSEALEWPLFTRQQLELIARHDEYRAQLRACLDERTSQSILEQSARLEGANDYGRAIAEVMLCLATRSEIG
jgi:hypothetical protein